MKTLEKVRNLIKEYLEEEKKEHQAEKVSHTHKKEKGKKRKEIWDIVLRIHHPLVEMEDGKKYFINIHGVPELMEEIK